VAAIVDARRAEVYWALYRSDGATLRQLVGPAVATPEAVAAAWEELDEGLLAVGDGAWRYREVFAAAGAEVASRAEMWPSPLVIAELGAQRLASGDAGVATGHAGAAVGDAGSTVRGPSPLYLRQADVRIGWDQVDGRVGPVVPGAGAG
jgi:tRNA threonylcarbamoyladenosine biosynthesis protein TsaB